MVVKLEILKLQHSLRQKLIRDADGFTIIEVLIVLAITGLLFTIAFITVGGKQNEVEFQQAINNTQSSLQQIISQVRTGNYQGSNNLSCTRIGGVNVNITSVSGSSTEGTNIDCMFAGKVIQFVSNTGTAPEEYLTYPLAGLRLDLSGNDCTVMNNCVCPTVIAPGNSSDQTFPNDGVPTLLQNGLSIKNMQYVNGANTTNIGAFAIMPGLSGGTPSSTYYLIPVFNTKYNVTPANLDHAVDKINNNVGPNYDSFVGSGGILQSANSTYYVNICLASGTTNQSGLITIGGAGGNYNSIHTEIYSDSSC